MPVTTVLDYVRTMDERGHISRAPNPADGRSITVSLTSSGQRVHDDTGRVFDKAMLPLLDSLDLPPGDVHRALRSIDAAAREALNAVAEEQQQK